jgi:hypothetical protein
MTTNPWTNQPMPQPTNTIPLTPFKWCQIIAALILIAAGHLAAIAAVGAACMALFIGSIVVVSKVAPSLFEEPSPYYTCMLPNYVQTTCVRDPGGH